MTSMRKRKAGITRAMLERNAMRFREDWLWDQMPPVGREFGSPDFERLMEEDHHKGVGIFDPALPGELLSGVEVPEDFPVQRRHGLEDDW